MPSYVAKPTPPNQDKRWKLVDATIRRQGQQQRGLIETLHTVQEAFGYLDEQALRYVAMSLRVQKNQLPSTRSLGGTFCNQDEEIVRRRPAPRM